MPCSFKVLNENSGARLGKIITSRGEIDTPAFMPVGTAATVKALLIDQVKDTGAQIILGNTYHLMLRPGIERISRVGGLHQFMAYDGVRPFAEELASAHDTLDMLCDEGL